MPDTELSPDERQKRAANLMRARKAAGFKFAARAAKAAEVPQRTYALDEAGRGDLSKRAHIYAKTFGTTVDDILGAQYAMPATEVPLLDFNLLGQISLEKLMASSQQSALTMLKCGKRCFTFLCLDRAMTSPGNPRILPGYTLGFDPDATIRPGDYVLAQVTTQIDPVFRIFYPAKGGGAIYKALNPDIEEIRLARSNQWKNLARLQFVLVPVESLG